MKPSYKALADAYLADPTRNAAAAYRKVYGDKGKKEDTAKRVASKILHDPEVAAYVAKKDRATNEKAELSIDVLKTFLANVLDGTEKDADFVNGKLKERPARLRDKISAAKLYGDCLGAYTANVNVEGGISVVVCGDNDVEE